MKVVTFGEIMLRLSPENSQRFLQTPSFRTYFGGSEANTAAALVQMGIDASFITKLPCNDIADACIKELSGIGVDMSQIARGGQRMGIYYCENGAGIRAGKVIYDRTGSSISEASSEDFEVNRILDGASLFHFTGITPALSDSAAGLTLKFVKAAKEKNISVSCDLNYRSKLWSKEKAGKVMQSLMPYTDILLANDGSVLDVFGIQADNDAELAENLCGKFGFRYVALTSRNSESADYNTLSGMIYTDGKSYYSPEIPVHIVDRVGGGDAFNAGIIYGILNGLDMQAVINTANAMNAFKHTVEGDYSVFNMEEISAIAAGKADGRIKR